MFENEAQNEEGKILKLAFDNKQIALAVLGQALMDKGGNRLTVYNSRIGIKAHSKRDVGPVTCGRLPKV